MAVMLRADLGDGIAMNEDMRKFNQQIDDIFTACSENTSFHNAS